MKRELRPFITLAAIALLLVGANHALAQTDSAREAGRQRPRGDSAGSSSNPASPSADASAKDRLVDRVRKMQEAMVKNLELDEKQLVTVTKLVEEFIRTLDAGIVTPKPPDARRMELKRLRDRMIEAKKRGDSAAFKSLRREWIDRTVQFSKGTVPTASLVQGIHEVLHKTQRREFRRILQRVQLDTSATLPPNALTTLLRSARDPSLNLTEDQQTAIRKIVREEILAIPKERRDPAGMKNAVPAIRDRIINSLTPAQGAKFRALLETQEKNDAALRKTKSTKRSATVAPTKKPASPENGSKSNRPDKN